MDDRAVQDPETAATLAVARSFLDAFARHDVDGVMAAMSEDCVFENTLPAPDGERHVGQAAVRRFWERFFRETPSAAFETEEMFAGRRAVRGEVALSLAERGRVGRATCEAWTSSASGTGRSPRSSPTSRASIVPVKLAV